MPTYTFFCPKCRHQLTDSFSMKDADGENLVCPRCKTKGLKRVWQGSFFIGKDSRKSSKTDLSCPSCSSGVCGLDH